MDDNFSPRVKDVLAFSKEEALRLGHDFIGTEHLLLGILRDGGGKAVHILDGMDIDLDRLRRKTEILTPATTEHDSLSKEKKNLRLTRQAERALKTTFLEAKLFQSSTINTAHLLLCILRNENDPTTKLLQKLKIDYDNVKDQFRSSLSSSASRVRTLPKLSNTGVLDFAPLLVVEEDLDDLALLKSFSSSSSSASLGNEASEVGSSI